MIFAHSRTGWKGWGDEFCFSAVPYETLGPLSDSEVRRHVREMIFSRYSNVLDKTGKPVPAEDVVTAVVDYADQVRKPFWYDLNASFIDLEVAPSFRTDFMGLSVIEHTLSYARGWKF